MTINEYLVAVTENASYIKLTERDDFYNIVDFGNTDIDCGLIKKITEEFNIDDKTRKFWDIILPYIPEKYIDDDIFNFLLKNKISLIELGHMNLDDNKLKKLIPYCEEALYTFIKRCYCDKQYSPEKFTAEIKKYLNDNVAIQLLYSVPSDIEKRNILLYFCNNSDVILSENVKDITQKSVEVEILKITTDINKIIQAYEKNCYIFHIAISGNYNTPDNILEALSDIRDIKFSKKIRENARNTLKIKKMLMLG